jgi:hypothetical protein
MVKEIFDADSFLQGLQDQGNSRVLDRPQDLRDQENMKFSKEAHAEFIYKNFKSEQEGDKTVLK